MVSLTYIKDFYKSRGGRIGASDVPALIPHPDKLSESLAGYGQTAITLWEEKVGIRKREPSGFAAEMGHYMEPKAISEFIRDFAEPVFGNGAANQFFRGFMLCELERVGKETLDCRQFNVNAFRHHTEAMSDFGVAHADCVYSPLISEADQKWKHTAHGLTVDFSKPFIIEAKSAQFWTVQARRNDRFAGYDLDLKEWQGIPLKHYFQLQYQMALYDIPVAYLALIYNTSEKHYWQVKANKKHQAELIELATYMKRCIDTRKQPKELAMNADDIRKLYPEIEEDFVEVTGPELEKAIKITEAYRNAATQEKIWKTKKADAENAMAVLLKGNREIKGVVGDELQTIARWKKTGGAERIMGLKEMAEKDPNAVKYLRRKGLINQDKEGEKPDIKLKVEG